MSNNPVPAAAIGLPLSIRRPANPSKVTVSAAISLHEHAFTAWIAARDRLHDLHERFDPDHRLDDQADIEAAMRRVYGPQSDDACLHFADMTSESTVMAEAEDAAWHHVMAIVPETRADLTTWLAYVQAHAAKDQEIVSLRQALQHVGDMLANQLDRAQAGGRNDLR